MIYYLILLLISLFFVIIHKPRNNKREAVILCFLIAFMIGFKDMSVSSDIDSYLTRFINAAKNTKIDTDEYEYGFSFYITFIKSLGFNFRWFLVISAYFTTGMLAFFIYKYSKNVAFSFFLHITIGLFMFSLSGMRQYMAMGIVLMAMVYIRRHRLFAILLLLIAMTVHYSSFICLIIPGVYYFSKYKISGKYLLILALSPLLALAAGKFFDAILPMINVVGRYKRYLNEENSINFISYFVIPYVMFLYSSYLYWKIRECSKSMSFCFLCSLVVALIAGVSVSLPMLSRFSYYFNVPMLVFIASGMTLLSHNRIMKLHIRGLIILAVIYYFVALKGNIMGIEDYHFCF